MKGWSIGNGRIEAGIGGQSWLAHQRWRIAGSTSFMKKRLKKDEESIGFL